LAVSVFVMLIPLSLTMNRTFPLPELFRLMETTSKAIPAGNGAAVVVGGTTWALIVIEGAKKQASRTSARLVLGALRLLILRFLFLRLDSRETARLLKGLRILFNFLTAD